MKNLANLNSTEWCDIVFEGKNKEYGAFKLRQSSWKRHILAFGVIVLFIAVVSFLPTIIQTVNANIKSYKEEMNETYKMIEIDNRAKEPEVIEIPQVELPAPPKYVAMDKFTAPKIVSDAEAPEETMKTMTQLTESKKAIGAFEVENGSTDPDAIRKELGTLIAGDGTGTGKGGEEKPQIVYTAEIMAQFPGGDDEMYKFISDNLRYPAIDQEMGNKGRVTIRFVVTKTGDISDIKVLKGISPTCDREAVRVVKSMPKWIPAKQNGVPVPIYFTLPIIFKLN